MAFEKQELTVPEELFLKWELQKFAYQMKWITLEEYLEVSFI